MWNRIFKGFLDLVVRKFAYEGIEMKMSEMVRWGVPTLAFLAYFRWGGFGLSFLLFGILLAIISALINWHKKDRNGFHTGMRAWIVLCLILPSVALTVITAASFPLLLPLAVIPLAFSIWLMTRNNRKIEESKGGGTMSPSMQNLHNQMELGATATANRRGQQARQRGYDLQSENLELTRKNAALQTELSKQKATRPMTLEEEDEELFGKDNPFKDPTPPSRSA